MQSTVLIRLPMDDLSSDGAEGRRVDAKYGMLRPDSERMESPCTNTLYDSLRSDWRAAQCGVDMLRDIWRSEFEIPTVVSRRVLEDGNWHRNSGGNLVLLQVAKLMNAGRIDNRPNIQIVAGAPGVHGGKSSPRSWPAADCMPPEKVHKKPDVGPPSWAPKDQRADGFVWRWTDKLLAELNSQMSALSSWYTQNRGTSRGSAKNARIDLATAWSVGTDTIKAKTTGESRRRGTSGVHKCT
ncbi:MAG: hypothetical protein HY856_10730 [Burkholderiales bacterium]|nr:hypothetical protein [Burkholderiales bacterium]